MLSRRFFLAAAAASVLPKTAFAEGPDALPIVIKIVAPLSDPVAGGWGHQMQEAGIVMQAEIRKTGGLLGRPVEIETLNDGGDPKQAKSVAYDIVGKHPIVVLGHGGSNTTKPAKDVYLENKIPFLMMANADELTVPPSPLAVRGLPSARNYAVRMNEIIQTRGAELDRSRIVVIADSSPYGKSLMDDLRVLLPPFASESIVPGERDVTAVVQKVAQAKPHILVFATLSTSAAAAVREMTRIGMHVPLMVGSGVLTFPPTAENNPGMAGVDIAAIQGCDPDTMTSNPRLAAARTAFAAQGLVLTDGSLATYAALDAVRQAIILAGSTDPQRLMDKIHTTVFDTPAGTMRWDADGNLVDPVLVDCKWNRVGSRMVQVAPQP